MTWPLALAIYFTVWWVVLFAVLPFGVRSHAEAGVDLPQGSDPGAPVAPRMAIKLVATTVVAALVFAAIYAYIAYEG
jgi:predicted secreted protein